MNTMKKMKLFILHALFIISGLFFWIQCEKIEAQSGQHIHGGPPPVDQTETGTPLKEVVGTMETVTEPLKETSKETPLRELRLDQDIPYLKDIKTYKIESKETMQMLTFKGTLDYNQDRYYVIHPRQKGIVRQVIKSIGDHVQEKDPLMVIESLDFAMVQQDYLDSLSMLDIAKKNLNQLKKSYQYIQNEMGEIDRMKVINEKKIKNEEEQRASSQSNYEISQETYQLLAKQLKHYQQIWETLDADLKRVQTLYDKNIRSEEDLLEMKRKKLEAEQEMNRIQQELSRQTGMLEEIRRSIMQHNQFLFSMDQESVNYSYQKNELGNQLTEVQRQIFEKLYDQSIHKNHLKKSLLQLKNLDIEDAVVTKNHQTDSSDDPFNITITAPISGLILERNANVGQLVQLEMPLYTLADLTHLWVYIDVYESDLASIHIGSQVSIASTAYPDRAFQAKVDYLGSQVDSNARTIKVRARMDNPGQVLLPGMYVNVTLHRELDAGTLTIPTQASIPLGNRFLVFVKKEGKSFEPRLVTLSGEKDGKRIIVHGLTAGEEIITDTTFLFDSETQLRGIIKNLDDLISNEEPRYDIKHH